MLQTNHGSLLNGRRVRIVVFLFFCVVINYTDRVNIAIAAPAIASHFHWDPVTMGWMFSSYLWTYIVCLIPAGWLVTRIGVGRTAAVAIAVWSLGAVLTGIAPNFFWMVCARLLLGLGEAACFPMCNTAVRQWFPSQERGFATGLYHAGLPLATAATTPLIAWAVLCYGWRESFVIVGAFGFIWLIGWLKWFHPPESCPWLSKDERNLILTTRMDSSADHGVSAATSQIRFLEAVGPLLRQKTMWGVFIAEGCANYVMFLILTWLPSYLMQVRGMHLMQAGIYTAIPFLVGGSFEVVLGKLSDHIYTPEELRQGKRRNMVALFLALTSVILLVNVVNSSFAIIALITVAVSCETTYMVFNFALIGDLVEDPQLVGTAFGIAQFSMLFGLVAPIITGYIVKATGSFASAFTLAGVLALIGTLAAITMTRKQLKNAVQLEAPLTVAGAR